MQLPVVLFIQYGSTMKIFFLFSLLFLHRIFGHEATTVIEVDPKFIVAGDFKAEGYLAREEASIAGPKTLEKAVIALNHKLLENELATAVGDLKKRITTGQKEGTRLIEITVKAPTLEEARRASNAVADAFIAYRKVVQAQRVKEVLAALDAKYEAQSKLAKRADERLINYVKQFGIPLLNPKGDLERLSETVARIKKAKPNERLAIMANMDLAVNTVTEPHRQYLQDLKVVDFLKKKHRPKHPDLKRG